MQAHWDRAYIDCRLWDREAGVIAVPGVGDFIQSRLPSGYSIRSRVDEDEMRVRYTIRASPSGTDESDVPIVEIADAIAEEIPKMFPGLFLKVSSEAAVQTEPDET